MGPVLTWTILMPCASKLAFLPPAPERIRLAPGNTVRNKTLPFRLAPGSFTKVENLIFNHHTRSDRFCARRSGHDEYSALRDR